MGSIWAATLAHLKLVLAEVARLKLQVKQKLTSKKKTFLSQQLYDNNTRGQHRRKN